MDKRIVIIHPEGNILNNPSLSGMVEILCEKGYGVDIYSLKHKFYQAAPCEGSRLMLREQSKPSGIWASLAGRKALRWIRKPQAQQCIDRDLYDKLNADLIIGVDRDGISEASAVAEKSRAPYGFISFEILFAEETGKGFKEPEIKVCRNISFAVCQDELRSGYLSTENDIRRDKIIDIPVAGRGAKRGEKNFYLHDKLGIGHDKHIALYMGTVHNWSGTSRLLTSVNEWPDEWALVMHPRYGMDRMVRPFYDEHKDSKKVYFSLDPVPRCTDISKVVKSADIGIALYDPGFDNYLTGNNLKYIGLAAGKVATYLQHGVPVLINETGLLSDYIKEYKLGVVAEDKIILPPASELDGYSERCYSFFEDKLDINKTIQPLLIKIKELIG